MHCLTKTVYNYWKLTLTKNFLRYNPIREITPITPNNCSKSNSPTFFATNWFITKLCHSAVLQIGLRHYYNTRARSVRRTSLFAFIIRKLDCMYWFAPFARFRLSSESGSRSLRVYTCLTWPWLTCQRSQMRWYAVLTVYLSRARETRMKVRKGGKCQG